MIRGVLVSVYNRTFGAVKTSLWKLVGSISTRAGLFQVLYVLALVGLMAGFVNAVAFPTSYQGVVYPGGGAQTIAESVIDAFVIMLGGAGIYLTYISGRQTTRARTVNLYLGLALVMIAVSLLTGIDLALLKGYG
jgi:hypothetical protein